MADNRDDIQTVQTPQEAARERHKAFMLCAKVLEQLPKPIARDVVFVLKLLFGDRT